MIKLKITPAQAKKELGAISHSRCQEAIPGNWVVDQGNVCPKSILWLFCWAKTGMNSDRAAEEAKRAFNNIFDRPYEWLDSKIKHEYARENRYKKSNIKDEFQALLCNSK